MKRLLALALLLVPALALEAGFKDQDVNGDGVPEKVAVTNLMTWPLTRKARWWAGT